MKTHIRADTDMIRVIGSLILIVTVSIFYHLCVCLCVNACQASNCLRWREVSPLRWRSCSTSCRTNRRNSSRLRITHIHTWSRTCSWDTCRVRSNRYHLYPGRLTHICKGHSSQPVCMSICLRFWVGSLRVRWCCRPACWIPAVYQKLSSCRGSMSASNRP